MGGGLGKALWRLCEGVGFTIDEVMSGEHELQPGFGPPGRRPLEFRVTWGPASVMRWLTPCSGEFLRQPLSGTITADGLCHEAPCQGTLDLRYFDERAIRYDFEFAVEGKGYRFAGMKVNIRPWNLPVSHTTLYGRITEIQNGSLVSTSVTRFRARQLPRMIRSLRVTRPEASSRA